ncbi:hypothetical protein [Parvibacter caecicola]|uniref:Uncharacterized protein n=2 Tax=Parvibacter caecicola TaxID=747645 RepID=A0A7W5D070_9ACTN|nr:hypothetical protein [Parvibacter caecicola]MBB3170322.1 hypothetical protein [Parvibacter caecicola]MCR2041713.1 hypothetical protein [Parvibacter caecicola]RNL09322.1 hypothetical protein DMP11_09095 [Parvibacter caecicola]
MSSLRERLLDFLRDDYCAHSAQPLQSQLGDFKQEEHQQAFRVQLKQLLLGGNGPEAQRLLVTCGHLAPQPPLAPAALRAAAETALASTPNGTAPRRRGNLCERVMECALDARMGAEALGSAEEREERLRWAREDYRRQAGPGWPSFSLEEAPLQAVIERLVGAEAEAWLYDAGYPAAELRRRERQLLQQDDWEAAVKEPARADDGNGRAEAPQAEPNIIAAPRRPRLKEIPLGLVERYQLHVYGGQAANAGGVGAQEAEIESLPYENTGTDKSAGLGESAMPGTGTTNRASASSESARPGTGGVTSGAADDSLQESIVQLWEAMAAKPTDYADVLMPLLLDSRSGAGLYLMGPDLLEDGQHTVEAWCGPSARSRLRTMVPRPPFFFVILRRSPSPNLDINYFDLLKPHASGADTRLENMNAEVLPPYGSIRIMAGRALAAFRDECATDPKFSRCLSFYRSSNPALPHGCPARFRPLFDEDDF